MKMFGLTKNYWKYKKRKSERTTAVTVAQPPFFKNNLQKHKNSTFYKAIYRRFVFLVKFRM